MSAFLTGLPSAFSRSNSSIAAFTVAENRRGETSIPSSAGTGQRGDVIWELRAVRAETPIIAISGTGAVDRYFTIAGSVNEASVLYLLRPDRDE
jgi:hypothetical protein